MNIYKKGDWVITEFNKYPVQLEEDGKFGFFDHTFTGNVYFFEITSKHAFNLEVERVYGVKDPRQGPLKYEGWLVLSKVRYAKKKDFQFLIREAKKQVKLSEKILKSYVSASNSLSK